MASATKLSYPKATSQSCVSDHAPETTEELEEILDIFRTKMTPYFPVIAIDPKTTVVELSTSKPFLWLVLRALCGKNVGRQRALGTEVRKVIGREMLLEGVKNLDILLGLLVYASWGHFFVTHKPIISPVIHLAIALAADLGLTRPVPAEVGAVMLNYSSQGCPKPPHALMIVPRTMEESRTILGVFLISSVAAIFFQRIEPLRWTPYLEDCLSVLSERKEFAKDELLVYLIRVQLICNGVATVSWNETYPTNIAGQRYPRGYYAYLFRSQLDELKRSIPEALQNNTVLQIHINNLELSILEHNLITSSRKDITSSPAAQVQRIEELWCCFTITKNFFDTFFDQAIFPPSTYPQISMSIYTHLSHCLVALFRLSTFDSPEIPWDRQRVITELDLGVVVSRWADLWVAAPAAAGIDTSTTAAVDGESHWEFTVKALTIIATWWDSKVAPKLRAEGQLGSMTNGFPVHPGVSVPMDPMDFVGVNCGLLDDEWMKDMLGGGIEFFQNTYF